MSTAVLADHTDDLNYGSLGGYLTGFLLAAVLSVLSFWLVITGQLSSAKATVFAIIAIAAVRVIVHMIFFLRMSFKVEDGWSMMSLIFTVVVVCIMLGGSLWIMHNLNIRVMSMQGMTMAMPAPAVPASVAMPKPASAGMAMPMPMPTPAMPMPPAAPSSMAMPKPAPAMPAAAGHGPKAVVTV